MEQALRILPPFAPIGREIGGVLSRPSHCQSAKLAVAFEVVQATNALPPPPYHPLGEATPLSPLSPVYSESFFTSRGCPIYMYLQNDFIPPVRRKSFVSGTELRQNTEG